MPVVCTDEMDKGWPLDTEPSDDSELRGFGLYGFKRKVMQGEFEFSTYQ